MGFSWDNQYRNLLFDCDGELKRPVNITLSNASGTGLPAGGVSYNLGNNLSYLVNSGFEPGNTYAADFEYADGSTDSFRWKSSRGRWNRAYGPASPYGDVRLPDLSAPVAGWNYSTYGPPMPGTVTSSIQSNSFNSLENLTTANNWFLHQSTGVPLSIGQNYTVYTCFQDALGDKTSTQASFTPKSSGPLINAIDGGATSGLVPATGGTGTGVTINGSGFTGASNVAFNGVSTGDSSTFTVVNDLEITTTVPQGAARGLVTVTAGGITGVSPAPFEKTARLTGTITNSSGTSLPDIELISNGAGTLFYVTSNSSGYYSLDVPAGIPIYLKFHDPAGTYRDVYSRFTAFNGTVYNNNYTLFSIADINAWEAKDSSFAAVKNNEKGMIRGRITRNNAPTNTPIENVTLTVRSKNYPKGNPAYKIIYGDAVGSGLSA